MGDQVKLYFSTIIADMGNSITVRLADEREICFNRKDILKLCLVHNYVLVRKKYAKERRLI